MSTTKNNTASSNKLSNLRDVTQDWYSVDSMRMEVPEIYGLQETGVYAGVDINVARKHFKPNVGYSGPAHVAYGQGIAKQEPSRCTGSSSLVCTNAAPSVYYHSSNLSCNYTV